MRRDYLYGLFEWLPTVKSARVDLVPTDKVDFEGMKLNTENHRVTTDGLFRGSITSLILM